MDEELAELTEHLARPGEQERPVLPVSEMTPVVQLLTLLVQLAQNNLQMQSKRQINFPPLPAPKTARQIVQDRRRRENRQLVLQRVAEAQARWAELNPDTTT